MLRILASLLAGAVLAASPAQAQFSAGWKFLEAVRKKEGDKVEQALSEPGSTIVNTKDVTTGETALHIVTGRRDLTWMSFLIGKGANVNARDVRGVTPLQLATNLGFIEGMQLLVESKARVDEPNDSGETPLIYAVHRRDISMVRVLLKAGADPDRKDNSGRSARDYAALDNNSQITNELQNNAKPRGPQSSGRVYGPSF